jgi:zinc transport system permease protein
MFELLLPAAISGFLLVCITGPLGSFIVWRRMSYFGDTLAHSSLLGVAIGFLLNITFIYSVIFFMVLIAGLLVWLEAHSKISLDTLLGILAHSSLSLGLVVISLMPNLRVDLMGYLFGDLLSVGWSDVRFIGMGVLLIAILLCWQWRSLIAVTVNEDLAHVEGIHVRRTRFFLTLITALTIGIAMKFVGALLITSLLVIPAASARRFSNTPEKMAGLAIVFGFLSVIGGLVLSAYYNTPAAPSVVLFAALFFTSSVLFARKKD